MPVTKNKDQLSDQCAMLVNRVRKNMRRLKGWRRSHEISCYRLYDRDIPEIPLCVDWYEGRLYIADVRRRVDDTDDLEPVVHWGAALADALSVTDENCYLKQRRRQRGRQQYQRLDEQLTRFPVTEGGLKFLVNLSDYLDTGLFLDHRITRNLVRSESDGCRVLNLFAYTGAFTVYAADGGAVETTTVDLSKTYTDWAQANLELNQPTHSEHTFVCADVMTWCLDAKAEGKMYDLVVVDPPTFSNSKRTTTVFDITRDHGELLDRVFDLVVSGGIVWFSTNARRFRLDEQVASRAHVTEMTETTHPPDFRQRPHRSWRLEKK